MKSLITCSLLICLQLLSPLVRADEAQQLADLFTRQSPSIVTVRIVLKIQANGGQATEARAELEGVVVSPDGLVMISDASYSYDRLKDVIGGQAGGPDQKETPTDFKIDIADDSKEYSGFLAASDKVLGLGFVKISDLGDKKLTAVDFSNSAEPALGQKLIAISRLSKGFDHAAYFQSATLCGSIDLPRKAYLLDGRIATLGLPIFTVQGQPVGVLTLLPPAVKNENDEVDFGSYMRTLTGGGYLHAFMVPASAVNATINQAKQRAIQVAAERARSGADKAPPPAKKPAAGKKP